MNWNTDYYVPVRRIQLNLESSAKGDSIVERALHMFQERIVRRCSATLTGREAAYTLTVGIDPTIGTDGYRISSDETGAVISANCPRAVVYGLGKYLHTSGYTAEGFHPSRWQGTSVPTSPMRGIQMDTHFCNSYHTSPAHELTEYVEDLALWGINYIDVVFPFIDLRDWQDPEVERISRQIQTIYVAGKALGIKVGMEVVPNQDFLLHNKEFEAQLCNEGRPGRGNGHNICPNIPGAIDYILSNTYGQVFRHLKTYGVELDFLCFWPYDEGGCGCEKCAPWGGNGYLKVCKAIWDAVKVELPQTEVILSTWCFDMEEWEALDKALADGCDWIDYIMAERHRDYPQYPLTHHVPGNLPLVNYPEISMWGLYPWGAFGANPLPEHFEEQWIQAKDHLQGGIAYSEGIFNDINKVVVSQFYWDRDTTADATLREYISYEYAPFVYDEVRQAIRLIEDNHNVAQNDPWAPGFGSRACVFADMDKAIQARDLLRAVDGKLDMWVRKSWRWRILVIRAELDVLRYARAKEQEDNIDEQKLSWIRVLMGCEEARPLLTELAQILHSNLDYDNEEHPQWHFVRPPVMVV